MSDTATYPPIPGSFFHLHLGSVVARVEIEASLFSLDSLEQINNMAVCVREFERSEDDAIARKGWVETWPISVMFFHHSDQSRIFLLWFKKDGKVDKNENTPKKELAEIEKFFGNYKLE